MSRLQATTWNKGAGDFFERRELYEMYGWFVAAFREASEKLRAGTGWCRSRPVASRRLCRLAVMMPAHLLHVRTLTIRPSPEAEKVQAVQLSSRILQNGAQPSQDLLPTT